MDITKTSKFLSLVLRHKPELLDLKMNSSGWVNVNELIRKINNYKGERLTREELDKVVAENNKKRFSYSEDGKMIRASQGHSISVDLRLMPSIAPDVLYHGTSRDFVDSIMKDGLKKMGRQHVHLSKDFQTAKSVGTRHGKPIVFRINTKEMLNDGFIFYVSDNDVWLTDNVPRKYLEFAIG